MAETYITRQHDPCERTRSQARGKHGERALVVTGLVTISRPMAMMVDMFSFRGVTSAFADDMLLCVSLAASSLPRLR